MIRPLLVLSILALTAPAAGAQPRTHDISLEDYFTLSWPTSVAVSPNGGLVAWTEMRWEDEDKTRNTDLWVADAATGIPLRLTFDPAGDTAPTFSPDGAWIYFKSSRKLGEESVDPPYNGEAQVWRIDPQGRNLQAVTRLPEGVDDYVLSADGRTLYYTTGTEHVDKDSFQDLRKQYRSLEFGHGVATYSELWALDLERWRARMLVDDRRVIRAFTVSTDQSRIAMLTNPDETLLSNEGWSRVDIYDAATAAISTLPDRMWRDEAPSPYGWILEPCFSPDGGVLAFRVDFDGYPGEVFFAHLDQGPDPVIRKMIRPDEVTPDGHMEWMPRGRTFCFTAEDHARRRIYGIPDVRDGEAGPGITVTPGDVVINSFGFGVQGDLGALVSTTDVSNDVYLARRPRRRADLRRVTRLNPVIDTWKIPQIQIVSWTSDDGTPVEGILELPAGYDPADGPLPLVVSIHGGPTSCSLYRFRYWIYGHTLFPARGWALFSPNYRGSTGYGDTFLTDLIGNKNHLDVEDILSGVNALIERGIADESRMAVMGWSNGGYLTNCVITRDSRFRAASSGAGIFDSAMQWSLEDTPGHVINFQKGLPWEQPDNMRKSSPLYKAGRIRTPTLIHVGENDPRTPPGHSRSLYRALRHYLNVPTELIVYPGEKHGLTKYKHRKAKMEWDHRWFDHHVLGKPDPDLE